MFVLGYTPGGAPHGIFKDEMDADTDDLEVDELDQPYWLGPALFAAETCVLTVPPPPAQSAGSPLARNTAPLAA